VTPARRLRAALASARHSLQTRLVLLFVALALATSAVFLGGLQRVLAGGWQAYARPLVADYVDRLAAELGTPPDPARAQALAARLPLRVRIQGPAVTLDTRPERDEADDPAEGSRDDRRHGPGAWGLSRTLADGHVVRFSLVAPPDPQRSRLVGWATLAALLALTAIAFVAVRRLLAPLRPIGDGVAAYTRGEFGRTLGARLGPRRRDDELGQLAARIDAMAGSLKGMLDAKRTLLLAISHELRSPLTRARLNCELLDDSPERRALLRDLGEMRDLIATLLESERLQQGHAALQAEPTDLAALLQAAAQEAADDGLPVRLQLPPRPPPPLRIDPTRVRLLLRNLLANARRHAAAAPAPPELFLREEPDGRLALGLRDHGPGVPDDELARLGEPFHRPDPARTRSTGGVGLGLHLCRLVAQAHGGELRLRLAQPGLEVAMVWTPAPA
jgi:signal transduction histidine kinase